VERKWVLLVVAAVAMAVILVAALMFFNGNDNGGNTSKPGPNEVWIDNLAFDPFNITVSVNTTVTWTNMDGTDHTVTSDDSSFVGGTLSDGDTFQVTFIEEGQYLYHCELHPDMRGVVTVVA
jgi:plastocyanin